MAKLRGLSDAALTAEIQKRFEASGFGKYFLSAGFDSGEDVNYSELSITQVKAALARTFNNVTNINSQLSSYLGETLANAIATGQTPLQIRNTLISDGKINAAKIIDKNGVERTIKAETRAATMARSELFHAYEDAKIQAADEILEEPIGIAETAGDSSVRETHAMWDGWAMTLDAWMSASDRPGQEPNCRCKLNITERRRYDGEINDSLPF